MPNIDMLRLSNWFQEVMLVRSAVHNQLINKKKCVSTRIILHLIAIAWHQYS